MSPFQAGGAAPQARAREGIAFDVLGRTLIIETDHPEVAAHISRAYARMVTADAGKNEHRDLGVISQKDAGFSVTFNGEELVFTGSRQPTNAFRAAYYGSSKLFRLCFRRNEEFRALYAASLRFGNQAVIIAARSETGKTTLALALIARGAKFYGDEFVFVRRADRAVFAFPRTLMIREPTLALLADARLQAACEAVPPRCSGNIRIWDHIDVADVFGEDVYAEPAPLGAVVALERAPDGRARAQRISPAVAAGKLRSRLSADGDGFEKITTLAELFVNIPCYELLAGDVHETASALVAALACR